MRKALKWVLNEKFGFRLLKRIVMEKTGYFKGLGSKFYEGRFYMMRIFVTSITKRLLFASRINMKKGFKI